MLSFLFLLSTDLSEFIIMVCQPLFLYLYYFSFASVIFIFSSEYSHLHKPAKRIQKDNLIQNVHSCVNINN